MNIADYHIDELTSYEDTEQFKAPYVSACVAGTPMFIQFPPDWPFYRQRKRAWRDLPPEKRPLGKLIRGANYALYSTQLKETFDPKTSWHGKAKLILIPEAKQTQVYRRLLRLGMAKAGTGLFISNGLHRCKQVRFFRHTHYRTSVFMQTCF